MLHMCVMTYLDLGPPVSLGASGDENSQSLTDTGDPAGSMSASIFPGLSMYFAMSSSASIVTGSNSYIRLTLNQRYAQSKIGHYAHA